MYLGPGSFAQRYLSWLLNPLSLTFKATASFALMRPRKKKHFFCQSFVISVDNLSFGGTGKTSLVIEIGNLLAEAGLSFAIVSRGYGGRLVREGCLVSLEDDSNKVGDEAVLIKRNFPDRDVFIGRDRAASIEKAVSRGNAFIILDDGLQRREIVKDLAILLVDLEHPFYYLRYFPGMRRFSDLVFYHDPGGQKTSQDTYRFKRTLICRPDGTVFDPGDSRIIAFAALGDGRRFIDSLSDLEIVHFEAFRDHHFYAAADLARLEKIRLRHRADYLLCTEKDLVKVSALLPASAPFLCVKNRIELNYPIMARITADAQKKGILAPPV